MEYLCQNSDMHTLCIVNGEKDSDFVQMTYTMLPELKTCSAAKMYYSTRFPALQVFFGIFIKFFEKFLNGYPQNALSHDSI